MSRDRLTPAAIPSAMHRLPGPERGGRRRPKIRRGLVLGCELERLECRVVPSTLLVTSLQNSGHGTLRSAIEKADHNRSGADTIKFAHSVKGTILLTNALPNLSTHLMICGPRRSLLTVARSDASGTPSFSIFAVDQRARVSISDLIIANGSAPPAAGSTTPDRCH